MAVGLGSVDMPVPSVAQWEWLNWKFPRPVYSGDTIYARWTLTQKRPPVGREATAIVVWRVDVHTADGAMCAEGEVGASVTRHAVATTATTSSEPAASPTSTTSRRRRRRRATPSSAGTKPAVDGPAPVVESVAEAAALKPATPERTTGSARRRRRRRPASSTAARNGDGPPAPVATAEAPAPPPPIVPTTATVKGPNPLSRVIRGLRRT